MTSQLREYFVERFRDHHMAVVPDILINYYFIRYTLVLPSTLKALSQSSQQRIQGNIGMGPIYFIRKHQDVLSRHLIRALSTNAKGRFHWNSHLLIDNNNVLLRSGLKEQLLFHENNGSRFSRIGITLLLLASHLQVQESTEPLCPLPAMAEP